MANKVLEITPQTTFNWIGVNVVPSPATLASVQEIGKSKFPGSQILTTPGVNGEHPYHLTICYGFDSKFFPAVAELVRKEELTDADLKWTSVDAIEPPHLKGRGIVYVDVISPKIEALKTLIIDLTGAENPAEKEGGGRKIPLHVTLQTLKLAEK